MRYAIIGANGVVLNVVEFDGADWPLSVGQQLIATDIGSPGDTWDGVTFTRVPPDNGPPPPPQTLLKAVGLVRFTAVAPINVLENIGLGPVSRLAKGRYRATFLLPLPTDSYSVLCSVKDSLNVRAVRVTARTTGYCEVRVTDTAGLAADAEEVAVKIEQVVTQ